MITIERKVHFGQGRRTRQVLREGDKPSPATPIGRVPRVSKLMALAIRFDQLIHDGLVTDQAELARLGHVTRARLTQIMNLLYLAPDIQEDLLFLTRFETGRQTITEKSLRPITVQSAWSIQRQMWSRITTPSDDT